MNGEGSGGKRGNLIVLPLSDERPSENRPSFERLSQRLKPAPDGLAKLIPLPPKKLSVRRAVDALKSSQFADIFSKMSDEQIYVQLAFPSKVKFSVFENEIELYDSRTNRPTVFTPTETLDEVRTWVKSWYFSFFNKGDCYIARYIDLTHPDFKEGTRLGWLEHTLRGSVSHIREDFDEFITKIKNPK